MSWASSAIGELESGKSVVIHPVGGSMRGLVESGSRVLLEPCDASSVNVGDIVLCTVGKKDYLHLVKAVDSSGVLIGNNLGRINGYASRVYGKAVEIGVQS